MALTSAQAQTALDSWIAADLAVAKGLVYPRSSYQPYSFGFERALPRPRPRHNARLSRMAATKVPSSR